MKQEDLNNMPDHIKKLNPELFFAIKDNEENCEVFNLREKELHNEIIKICKTGRWVYFHGSTAHATHRTLGEPDFIILLPGGKTLLVECKTQHGKTTPEQLDIIYKAKALGHTIHIVRSKKQFIELVKKTFSL